MPFPLISAFPVVCHCLRGFFLNRARGMWLCGSSRVNLNGVGMKIEALIIVSAALEKT
jgi:hypothetical protein